MSFREIEEVRGIGSSSLPSADMKKRKISISGDSADSDQRTGRWTSEETAYVDELVSKFDSGCLPLVDGIKLNDFLAGMLQCKQSRLTKKMKNSRLSSKCFKRTTGHIADLLDAREFSNVEDAFFSSIQCLEERAAIKFQTQKQWRELFSTYCASKGQPLDADAWLTSVEDIERRSSMAKDAARMARRKLIMGKAYSQDCKNPDRGVLIDHSDVSFGALSDNVRSSSLVSEGTTDAGATDDSEEFLALLSDKTMFNDDEASSIPRCGPDRTSLTTKKAKQAKKHSVASPFLGQVMDYLKRIGAPFEHADAWVPSMISPVSTAGSGSSNEGSCRLCYAGSASSDVGVSSSGIRSELTSSEEFNLVAFAQYSQKFSFKVGCGLPGRVYQSGVSSWEQNVHHASFENFERCGGAIQCGIKTAVGIPVPSANVGRIIVLLYSFHDRPKDQALVNRLLERFAELSPSPTWRLVVELGDSEKAVSDSIVSPRPDSSNESNMSPSTDEQVDHRIDEVVTLLGQHVPSDPSSPLGMYLQGFMSLRLLLLRSQHSQQETELVGTLLSSYSSYVAAGRTTKDIAMLLARDCMFLMNGSMLQ